MAARGADAAVLRRELAAGRIEPVYLLTGEESFLKEDAASRIRAAVLGSDLEAAAWNLMVLEGASCSVPEILDAARTLPMFAARRLVWVKDSERIRDAAAEPLREYLESPSPGTCIVFSVGAGKPDFRKALFKALQRSARVLDFQPLKGAALVRWIRERAKELQADIDEDAAVQLELQAGPDLRRMDQELRKALDFAAPSRRISSAVLGETLGTAAAGSLFEFAERAGAAETEPAIRLLRGILAEGEEPARLLFLLARHLRMLILGQALMREGQQGRDLAAALGIPPYPFLIEKAQQQIRRFPPRAGAAVVRLLLGADRALKSGSGKPAGVLERLVLDLTLAIRAAGLSQEATT